MMQKLRTFHNFPLLRNQEPNFSGNAGSGSVLAVLIWMVTLSPIVNLLRSPQETIPSQAGRYDISIWRAGPPYAGEIDSLESIPRLLKRLQIRALIPHGNRNTNLIRMTTHVFWNTWRLNFFWFLWWTHCQGSRGTPSSSILGRVQFSSPVTDNNRSSPRNPKMGGYWAVFWIHIHWVRIRVPVFF